MLVLLLKNNFYDSKFANINCSNSKHFFGLFKELLRKSKNAPLHPTYAAYLADKETNIRNDLDKSQNQFKLILSSYQKIDCWQLF